jgi:hypothetical protein
MFTEIISTPYERTWRKPSPRQRALEQINENTVNFRRSVGNSYSVFFLGIELGQIRPLDTGWGWRTRSGDRTYPTKQEAAIAFTNWILRRFWSQFSKKVEKELCPHS